MIGLLYRGVYVIGMIVVELGEVDVGLIECFGDCGGSGLCVVENVVRIV